MTGKRGRPPKPEEERWQLAQTAQRYVAEEMAGQGTPSAGKANKRAARRLGVSIRTLKRLLPLIAEPPPRMTWDEWQQDRRDDWQVDSLDW